MPAPKGNLNTAKHGGQISRLTLGSLPTSMARHVRKGCKYRRELEELVLHERGEVSLADAHIIDEAATAEIHAGVCRWLLRERLQQMSPSDIARCSEQIVKAKQARNKAFRDLGLDTDDTNTIRALYTDAAPEETRDSISRSRNGTDPMPNTSEPQNATDANLATPTPSPQEEAARRLDKIRKDRNGTSPERGRDN